MSYTESDLQKCRFNPLTPKAMLETYPKLKDIFTEPDDAIMRYTILLYDPKSPLLEDYKNLDQRRQVAADMFIDAELDTLQDQFVLSAVDYLKYINDKIFAAACATEYKFWEAISLIMQPISRGGSDSDQLQAANKKNVLSDSMDDSIKKLDGYAREMSGGDTVVEKKMKKRFTSVEKMLKTN